MWLDGVLPLVLDREASIAEKSLLTMEEIFLCNIVPHSRYVDRNVIVYDINSGPKQKNDQKNETSGWV